MYVCVCNAVTESDIRRAVDRGVRNLHDLTMETGCSSGCGRCAGTALEVLDEALDRSGRVLKLVSSNSRVA